MESLGQKGHDRPAGVLPDHLEFPSPEHRLLEWLGNQERPPGLDEHPHGLGPSGVPAV